MYTLHLVGSKTPHDCTPQHKKALKAIALRKAGIWVVNLVMEAAPNADESEAREALREAPPKFFWDFPSTN